MAESRPICDSHPVKVRRVGEMQGLLVGYIGVAVVVLALSTTIKDDTVALSHILIAALAWPLFMTIFAAKVWLSRGPGV